MRIDLVLYTACTRRHAGWQVEVKVFADTASCFDQLHADGYSSYATTMHSEAIHTICTQPVRRGVQASTSLYQTDWTQNKMVRAGHSSMSRSEWLQAVWFGNESKGLTAEALTKAEHHVHIDMQGMIESLNLVLLSSVLSL